jgi:hypothetical protein
VREFNLLEYKVKKISIRVLDLLKYWLMNRHVAISNDMLNKINNFIRDICGSPALIEPAFEIMDKIRDRTQVLHT